MLKGRKQKWNLVELRTLYTELLGQEGSRIHLMDATEPPKALQLSMRVI